MEILNSEMDDLEFVGSVLECLSCMATNDDIKTGHVANVAAECSGKLKAVIDGVKVRQNAGY